MVFPGRITVALSVDIYDGYIHSFFESHSKAPDRTHFFSNSLKTSCGCFSQKTKIVCLKSFQDFTAWFVVFIKKEKLKSLMSPHKESSSLSCKRKDCSSRNINFRPIWLCWVRLIWPNMSQTLMFMEIKHHFSHINIKIISNSSNLWLCYVELKVNHFRRRNNLLSGGQRLFMWWKMDHSVYFCCLKTFIWSDFWSFHFQKSHFFS